MPEFLVIAKASSAARIAEGEELRMSGVPTGDGLTVDVVFTTVYLDEGFKVTVPRELKAEIFGSGSSLDEALSRFVSVAEFLASVVTFCANAGANDLQAAFGYDCTPGHGEHDYFQAFVPNEGGLLRVGRQVPLEASRQFIRSLIIHPRAERIIRAIQQYDAALRHWHPGGEVMAVAHLWMASEALTRVIRDRLYQDLGCSTNDELAKKLGVVKTALDGEIRRSIVFENDRDTYKAAKETSDGLEHSFASLDQIHVLAKGIRDQVAASLRRAIVREIDLDDSTKSVLIERPYFSPLGAMPIQRYLRGKLVGDGTKLGVDGHHPNLTWRSMVKSLDRNSVGRYLPSVEESYTSSFATDVVFKPTSMEMWGTGEDGDFGTQASVQVT